MKAMKTSTNRGLRERSDRRHWERTIRKVVKPLVRSIVKPYLGQMVAVQQHMLAMQQQLFDKILELYRLLPTDFGYCADVIDPFTPSALQLLLSGFGLPTTPAVAYAFAVRPGCRFANALLFIAVLHDILFVCLYVEMNKRNDVKVMDVEQHMSCHIFRIIFSLVLLKICLQNSKF
uniref:Rab-GAP TBC domain-containing protein n=1 Tax=Ascaris lumbricoides TaxID=6252 RepID=A0A0M3I060_ASCLU